MTVIQQILCNDSRWDSLTQFFIHYHKMKNDFYIKNLHYKEQQRLAKQGHIQHHIYPCNYIAKHNQVHLTHVHVITKMYIAKL